MLICRIRRMTKLKIFQIWFFSNGKFMEFPQSWVSRERIVTPQRVMTEIRKWWAEERRARWWYDWRTFHNAALNLNEIIAISPTRLLLLSYKIKLKFHRRSFLSLSSTFISFIHAPYKKITFDSRGALRNFITIFTLFNSTNVRDLVGNWRETINMSQVFLYILLITFPATFFLIWQLAVVSMLHNRLKLLS